MRTGLVLVAALLVGCGATPPAAAPPPPRLLYVAPAVDLAAGEEELSMEIIELMCRPCAAKIVSGSRALAGVTSVSMELPTRTLTVRFDTSVTDRAAVFAAVEQIVASIQ